MKLGGKVSALERRLPTRKPTMNIWQELEEIANQNLKWADDFLAAHKDAAPLFELINQKFTERVQRAKEAKS